MHQRRCHCLQFVVYREHQPSFLCNSAGTQSCDLKREKVME
jgi:hypothetical protein